MFSKGYNFLAAIDAQLPSPACALPSTVRRPFYSHAFLLLSFQSSLGFLTLRNITQEVLQSCGIYPTKAILSSGSPPTS